jgi:oligopeptide transport system substrate-binding protein
MIRLTRPPVRLLVCLGLPLLAASGCFRAGTRAESARRANTLLLGNGAEPQDLDPQVCTAYTDYNVLISLFEGLTCIDERTSQAVPGAADRWEVSPDGLTYVFHIRDAARWSDGDPLTAGDFVYSFRRILSPSIASEYAYMLYFIDNAEAFNEGRIRDFGKVGAAAIDPKTLRIRLGHPCPFLPAIAAHQSWFPVHRPTIEKFDAGDRRGTAWTRPGNLVGNGPFILKEWRPNDRIVVARNPLYWDAAHSRLDSVVFFPNESIATDENNFRAGQLHVTYDLLPERIEHYRRDAPQFLRVDPFSESFFLRFNVTRPPLDDRRVRQALARAIDREAIARDVLYGSRTPAYALVPPDTGGYTSTARVPVDFEAARRLLADAGYPGGRNFPRLELQMNSDAINSKIMEAIQQMWLRELGVRVELSNEDFRVYLDNQRTLHYQISRSRWVGDYDDPSTYLYMFKSDSGNNQTGWSSAAYDRLNDEADRTRDAAKRFGLLQKAEAILLDDAPIAPIFYGTRTYLIQTYVKGWEPSLLGIHRYQYLEFAP